MRHHEKTPQISDMESEMIFDIYDFIPSYGINRLKIVDDTKEHVSVLVFFDAEDDNDPQEKCIELRFHHVVDLSLCSFPGVEPHNYPVKWDPIDIFQLQKSKDSTLALKWEQHFNGLYNLDHYRIVFDGENKRLEVVCVSFELILTPNDHLS